MDYRAGGAGQLNQTTPASSRLCWEGVALGWREEPPGCLGRPRSRGGDLPIPPSMNKGLYLEDPAPSLSSVKSDSALNSMEYWDYSVELECLSGPEDLQLAAELGKTLLERNRELENSLKHQQAIIDDQAQEIEYLTKQTAALREVNDSRLRIYEQLEDAIADLEKTNNRLDDESKADKSKIKSLCSNVDILEARCEELQRGLDDARCQERQRKRRDRRRGSNKEENSSRKGSGIEPTTYQSLAVGEGETSDYEEEDSPSPPSPPSPSGHDDLVRVHQSEGGSASRGRESIHSSTSTDSFWQQSTDEERSNSPQERQVLEEPSTLDVMTMMGDDEGDIARLNREVAWLSEETRLGDRRARELEEQVQSLVSENACLKSRLECGFCDDASAMQFQRQSTVEQEVLALEEVSEGLVCKRCLGIIDEPTSMTLVGEVLRRSAAPVLNWATKRGYDREIQKAVFCFVRRVGCSTAWLDTWLCLVTFCTLLLSLLRALVGAPLEALLGAPSEEPLGVPLGFL